jgi:uncharacterized protein YndB with AHSA1/START domain
VSDTQTLEFSANIDAPVKQVFAAFSSSIALESWFADFAEIVPQEKGRIYLCWDTGYYASGLITKIEPEKQLAFSWNGLGEPCDTQVDLVFEENETGTTVTIRHSEVGTSTEWTERIQQYKSGWDTALKNLKSVMETGLDKRIFDRPMLGIFLGAIVDEKQAGELGIPVSSAIRLAGVMDGMGAQAAGLQTDDVLISLNGRPLEGYQDFAPATEDKKAGDVVEAVYYRGNEKHTVQMELSRRTLELPESAAALAGTTAKIYAEVAKERDALFEGISDAEASMRPTEREWSAKETLVHLLYTERWVHLAISCSVSEQRAGGFANQLKLIAAMADSYPLEELLAELKRSEEVTVASLRALPDDFVTDKRKFARFVMNVQGFDRHTRSHFDQIKDAIDLAKKNATEAGKK